MWRLAALALLGCGRVDFDDVVFGAYRKPITIDHTKVGGGPHTGFPLLIELAADADLAADARPDGFDIAFTSAAGAALPYERESYDAATGALVAWVRVPLLDGSADTRLYMVFGDPGAADQQAPASVWDASFAGVWHAATTLDSTAHRNGGSVQNGVVFGAGQIGGGFVFDGVGAIFDVPASASLTSAAAAGTFSVWIRWTNPANGAYQQIMSSSNRFVSPRNGFEWANQAGGEHYFYPWGGSETAFDYVAVPPFASGTWEYIAVTFDYASKAILMYLDAQPLTTSHDGETGWAEIGQPADWLWGGNPAQAGPPNYFAGAMDELRVASVVRSQGWLQTEFVNQRSPSTFYTVGPLD